MCWWAFTGLTHILLAGHFLFTPDLFSRENPSYFDELCKFPGAPSQDRCIRYDFGSSRCLTEKMMPS
jgi:hypothetical protein